MKQIESRARSKYKFNLNIGCIWIRAAVLALYWPGQFNLNIGCIWILRAAAQPGNG